MHRCQAKIFRTAVQNAKVFEVPIAVHIGGIMISPCPKMPDIHCYCLRRLNSQRCRVAKFGSDDFLGNGCSGSLPHPAAFIDGSPQLPK
jgi:hypothetical protein